MEDIDLSIKVEEQFEANEPTYKYVAGQGFSPINLLLPDKEDPEISAGYEESRRLGIDEIPFEVWPRFRTKEAPDHFPYSMILLCIGYGGEDEFVQIVCPTAIDYVMLLSELSPAITAWMLSFYINKEIDNEYGYR